MFIRKCLFQRTSFQKNFQNATSPSACLHPVHNWRNFCTCETKNFLGTAYQVSSNFPISKQLKTYRYGQSRCKNSLVNIIKCKYSTHNLFRLTETSASQLQPYLDVEHIIKRQELIQESINKRQLSRKDVKHVEELYGNAQKWKVLKEKNQQLREETTEKCQAIIRGVLDKDEKDGLLRDLKEKGRQLREEVREAENKFNQVNDDLVDFILSLPNTLDKDTPVGDAELLNEFIPEKTQWNASEYTAVETQCGPGLLAEFPVGQTAWNDIDLRGRAQTHLLDGGFIETGNAEYVKRIILQGAGLDHTQFLRVREPNVKKGWEHATYLAGGASFPSFLALFAQSIIENPITLPMRYFVVGRSYESQKTKPGFYQSHGVQAFVACRNEEEMKNEFAHLQSLMESFYADKIGFAFQTQMVPAHRLKMFERKKVAFVMNKTDTSPSKMIGTLSTVGDYVSKRLLCCYFGENRKAQFLHLISAKFFDITHFLRSPSPKLITHADILAKVKPQQTVLTFDKTDASDQL